MISRAVTFDLDGTLVDLRSVYVRAHQIAVREVLDRDIHEAQVLRLMETGAPIRTHMALLDEAAADLLVDAFVVSYRLERAGLVRTFPGVPQLVARIRDAGVPVAVVTSKLRMDALAELEASGLLEAVDAVVAFEDTESHKPGPAPHVAALRAVDASAGVGVGDLPSDVASARAAGLVAIGVCWGYGSGSALLAAGATRACETAEELEVELWSQLDRSAVPESEQPR